MSARYFVQSAGRELEIELTARGPDRYSARVVAVSGAPPSAELAGELEVIVLADKPTLAVTVGGRVLELSPHSPSEAAARGSRQAARLLEPNEARAASRDKGRTTADGPVTVKAPMPGRIVKVFVSAGDSVNVGQPALVIEAMKMENQLVCPRAGTVREVRVSAGAAVERGAALLIIA